tara:strand:+ start:2167 stop:2604 length:438 start_codon:yes stop_codon:yes gene_type:complete
MMTMRVDTGPKIRKGDLVKLNPNDPEIIRLLEWEKPRARAIRYMASRPTTPEEREEWREERRNAIHEASMAGEDTFHIAFNDAGESRLPPQSTQVPLPIDRIYVVERARCRVALGWGRAVGGMTKLLDTSTGETAYVRRDMLELV